MCAVTALLVFELLPCMQSTRAYGGWGTHEFDESPVFMVNLPKDPAVYSHEFYVDTVDGSSRLHHRMIDTEVDDAAFTHDFEWDEGESVLSLLIKHRSYWLGFADVDGDGIEGNIAMFDGPPSPDDGLFVQQHIRDPAFKRLVQIAKMLYLTE